MTRKAPKRTHYGDGSPIVMVQISDRVLGRLLNYAEWADPTGGNDTMLNQTVSAGDYALSKALKAAGHRAARVEEKALANG
jgi:hypothetical protein